MTTAKKKSSSGRKKSLTPRLNPRTPVDWWFLFKLNADEEEGDTKPDDMKGEFDVEGWQRPAYEKDDKKFSQHYLFASERNSTLKIGRSILGSTPFDPLGSTFAQVYFGCYNYVIWNDQFYDDPRSTGGSPWGHSKGMLTWNDDGEGFVMQVSTPSWPASGSSDYPRETDGNTLGYVSDDDIEVSQHFFALKLTKPDVLKVLAAMQNASIVTGVNKKSVMDTKIGKSNRHIVSQTKKINANSKLSSKEKKADIKALGKEQKLTGSAPPDLKQVINNGGPEDVQALVNTLGKREKNGSCTSVELSSGVTLISKPSNIAVPPWQMVSAMLGGVDLRVASWWAAPQIYSTTRTNAMPKCWDKSLGKPGAVDIATSGSFTVKKNSLKTLGFIGTPQSSGNHAKIGVSTSKGSYYSIFGDMNQQGALCAGDYSAKQTCSSSQNGRGGLFYVMKDKALFKSMSEMLAGESAPTEKPAKK